MTVIDKDLGFNGILDRLADMDGEIDIGILDNAGNEENGETVANVAAYNEYGTNHIPSRPFMRQTADKHGKAWGSFAQRATNRVIDGMGAEQAKELIGNRAEGDMKKMVTQGDFVPNAPNTIKQKGSSTPLIDTGRMRNSISHRVKD